MYTINLATGVVTRNVDQRQVAPAQSVEDPYYLEYLAWCTQGNAPTEVRIEVEEERKITTLAFRNRFTLSEKVAMEMASLDNPSAEFSARTVAASLRVYMKDVDNASHIDLARADTQGGVMALVQFGLLTAERADAIINAPIQAHEVPLP